MKNSTPLPILKKIIFSLLLLQCSSSYSQNAVTTLAGSSQGYNDAVGSSAKFKAPTGICISPDGTTLYVADYSGHRIRKIIIATKTVSTLVGDGTSGYVDASGTSAKLSYPSGVCVSSTGTTLYVCDYGNGRIRKIDLSTNSVTTVAGDGNFAYADNSNGLLASFNGPTDLKLAGDSVLYISDTDNHLIRKVNTQTTQVSTVAGMVGVGGFQNGSGANAAFRLPKGLALSNDQTTLYVADNGNHMIRAIDLTNYSATTVAGNGTPGYADNSSAASAMFNSPNGVAVVPGNNNLLYVADNGNNRLRKIDMSASSVSTIAGTGAVPPSSTFADNSNGMNAKFFYPTNMIVSPSSADVYVADQGNFRVRDVKTDLTTTSSDVNLLRGVSYTISPNPITDYVTLNIKSVYAGPITLEVFDAQGKLLLSRKKILASSSESMNEDFSELPSGIFLFKISSASGYDTKKIIVTK
jgi:sugar lactone lactonase YvrE